MGWTIEAVRDAPVEPAAVFALYADPSTWSSWGHNATRVRSDGPLADGATVEVRANYGRVYPCLVRRFEQDRALELVVRPPGMTIVNVYEVEPSAAGGSRIRHAFEISGAMGTVARFIGLRRIYSRKLAEEVEAVARMAAGASPTRGSEIPVSTMERALHGAERRVGTGTWED
jgi:hypothetical protein